MSIRDRRDDADTSKLLEVQTFPTTEDGLQAVADKMREISKRKDDEEEKSQPQPPPPGQVAYEAYEKRYGVNFHNRPSPPWLELEEIKKDAWNVAAVALQKHLPQTTVLVEGKDQEGDREKRAWSPNCPECGHAGRPIRGEGEYANAKYCSGCEVLFGWQVPVEPPWSAA